MSYEYRPNSFSSIPLVVKNLLIINGLFFLATMLFRGQLNLQDHLALHYFTSSLFQPYQFVTYMFMHADLVHIFFNMFGLFMFGNILETLWGPKRFLIFYMTTGIGAALVYLSYQTFEFNQLQAATHNFFNNASPEEYISFIKTHFKDLYDIPQNQTIFDNLVTDWMKNPENPAYATRALADINQLITIKENTPMVGASGAIFGILVAYGMLFPNTELMLMFIPIPIKAKYAVILYSVAELFFGVARFSGDNIAHFAHLGGALFGFILVKYWQKNSNRFY
jgi:membrane associated rhomboid family serine protease